MRVESIVAKLTEHGVSISAQQGKLSVAAAKGALTGELVALIKGNKPALVDFLQTQAKASKPNKAVSDNVTQVDYSAPVSSLDQLGALPFVYRADDDFADLYHWLEHHQSEWQQRLAGHGALLFRGFGIDSIDKMARFAELTISELKYDNAEHQSAGAQGSVQTPVDYAPDQFLLWHNENTFNQQWPQKIAFSCAEMAEQGGATPLVDAALVYDQIDPQVRQKFIDKGVMYVRNYRGDDLLGLSWKTVFNSEDKKVVEAKCIAQGIRFEWTENDGLTTRAVRPAVYRHPQANKWCWVNQAQHWHFSCLNVKTRTAIEKLYSQDQFPRNCYFGDGSVIDDLVMADILAIYQRNQLAFAWQLGDVVLVDNALCAHARNPFSGQRKLLVSMGDSLSFLA